jgi:hypothetical protein
MHSWSKNKKILSIFVSKGQRVNRVLEKNHNQTFPKKQTKEDNKVRASTRIQHTHVSKPKKTVR